MKSNTMWVVNSSNFVSFIDFIEDIKEQSNCSNYVIYSFPFFRHNFVIDVYGHYSRGSFMHFMGFEILV